jgi:tellurite resistance protein
MSTIDEAKKALTTPKMEALIEAMYIAANADEDFGPKEREQFVSNVVGICNGAIKPDEVKGVLLKLKGKAKEGIEVRLKSIAGRLPSKADKEHAFALACNMALADGVVLDEEKSFTDQLAKALGIEEKRAETILEEIR